jgi:hypothetical protein
MTWLQDFEMDPKASLSNEQVAINMKKHMEENQTHFKEILEALAETR